MNPMMLNTQREKNSSRLTAEQKLFINMTLTRLYSHDMIDREARIQCHVVDYECDKGHEIVEALPFAYETSRAIHVNIDLRGHAKKEEIHRQAENLRQSLRDYMNAMQSLPPPKAAGTLTSAPTDIIYQAPLPYGQNAPCMARG